jgi:MOSC domain-containing protein YiiM
MECRASVIAVSCGESHRFSKPNRPFIRLIEGHGIEGDAHAGHLIRHRYQAKQTPERTNDRQVHLIHAELFDELSHLGFSVGPGELGENITTRGIELLGLPLGTRLRLGRTAVIELTGLRTPCGYIDRFQKGLKRLMIVRTGHEITFRVGVMAIACASGDIAVNDPIVVELPNHSRPLPAL